MKMYNQQREFKSDIDTNERRGFHIKQNAHTFRILSDSIYSDKPLAVVRELGCNAWDAHVAAKNTDTPFNIHLPNDYEPYFSIKDFGVGLSEEDIYNLYCTYGGTNKDQSNEFVGGFGLGSKSCFAYTDQFTVTSIHGGRKMMFNAFIDQEGIPQVVKISDIECLDHPGLEVYMPVEQRDFGAFRERAKKVFSRFPLMPKIDGIADFRPDVVKYVVETDTYKLRDVPDRYGYDSDAYALQGLVAYPIKTSSMQTQLTNLQHTILNSPFDLVFPLGELAMTASREQLNYDKRTEANVIAKVDQVAAELPKLVQDKINACANLYDAMVMYNRWFRESSLRAAIKEHIGKKLKYKNEDINEGSLKYNFSNMEKVKRPDPITGGEREFQEEVSYVELLMYPKAIFDMKRITSERKYKGSLRPSDEHIFIYDDVGSRIVNPKVEYHFKEEGKHVTLIRCDKKHLSKVKKQLGGVEIKKWSEYEEPPKEYFERVQSERVIRKLLEFNEERYGETWNDTNHDVQNGGYYVITYAREPKLKHMSLRQLVNAARTFDFIDDSDRVFGIQTAFKKIPETYDGWVQIEDHVKKKLEEHINNINLPKVIANYEELQKGFYHEKDMKRWLCGLERKGVVFRSTRTPMARLVAAYTHLNKSVDNVETLVELCKAFGIKYRTVKPDFDLIKLIIECKTRYPLLDSLYYRGNYGSLKHYIDVCDASPSIKPDRNLN